MNYGLIIMVREIKKIETGNDELKIPHMGWDDTIIKKNTRLLRDMKNPVFYYLHSYFLEVKIIIYFFYVINNNLKKDNVIKRSNIISVSLLD